MGLYQINLTLPLTYFNPTKTSYNLIVVDLKISYILIHAEYIDFRELFCFQMRIRKQAKTRIYIWFKIGVEYTISELDRIRLLDRIDAVYLKIDELDGIAILLN